MNGNLGIRIRLERFWNIQTPNMAENKAQMEIDDNESSSNNIPIDMIKQEKKVAEEWADKERKKKFLVPEATGRTGGVYIPPFKLKRLQEEIATADKKSVEYQRISWDALRKSINGYINKINTSNITNIIKELFQENLIRGRGLLIRSIMKAQMASTNFSHVYSALISVINTKIPEIGELLLKRLIMQFRRAYRRNDKIVSTACIKFIAHLVNQKVAHEIIALQLLTLFLDKPTDDSVELAVVFMKECGQILAELSPRGNHAVFERFRGILHEGLIDKRIQYTVEDLFAVRKNNFIDFPSIILDLDLVEVEEQFTHEMSLTEDYNIEDKLNIFHFDEQWEDHEKEYEQIAQEIIGDESEIEDDDDDEEKDDEEEVQDDEEKIQDETEAKSLNLRKMVYKTIMSSVDIEECAHKLLKIKMEPKQEIILCKMIVECCMHEGTYLRFFGLLGQRFCLLNPVYQDCFDDIFAMYYMTIHRLETNKLRNVANFYSHLLYSDALDWGILEYIRLTEEDTTASGRIFIKILFQELATCMGMDQLRVRLENPNYQDSFSGLFLRDTPKNTRFCINFFTSIGLGPLTDSLREFLKEQQKLFLQKKKEKENLISDSDESSESSSESSSDSSESSSTSSESSMSSNEESSSSVLSSSSNSPSRSHSPPLKRSRSHERHHRHSYKHSHSPIHSSKHSYSQSSRYHNRHSSHSRDKDSDRYSKKPRR